MMQLYIVRHADSKFVTSATDHQRPLTAKGLEQAKQSAHYLQQIIGDSAAQIISSDALRTLSTATTIQQCLSHSQMQQHVRFYHARVGDWCDAIMANQHASHLVLVGHNPTISQLAYHLNPKQALHFNPACIGHYQLEIAEDGLNLPSQLIDFFKPDATI